MFQTDQRLAQCSPSFEFKKLAILYWFFHSCRFNIIRAPFHHHHSGRCRRGSGGVFVENQIRANRFVDFSIQLNRFDHRFAGQMCCYCAWLVGLLTRFQNGWWFKDKGLRVNIVKNILSSTEKPKNFRQKWLNTVIFAASIIFFESKRPLYRQFCFPIWIDLCSPFSPNYHSY